MVGSATSKVEPCSGSLRRMWTPAPVGISNEAAWAARDWCCHREATAATVAVNDSHQGTPIAYSAAEAKISAAASQTQALGFLDRTERAALLSDPRLLERWAALPR